MTKKQVKQNFRDIKLDNAILPPISIVIAKKSSIQIITPIQQDWATFDQMWIVPHHVLDTDAIITFNIRPNSLSNPPCKPIHGVHQRHNKGNTTTTTTTTLSDIHQVEILEHSNSITLITTTTSIIGTPNPTKHNSSVHTLHKQILKLIQDKHQLILYQIM